MLTQELVKISRRFIGRVKITSQDLDHFSHTSRSGRCQYNEVSGSMQEIILGYKQTFSFPLEIINTTYLIFLNSLNCNLFQFQKELLKLLWNLA